MKNFSLIFTLLIIAACNKDQGSATDINNNPDDTTGNNPPPVSATFDLDPSEAPKFVNFNYIESDSILKISRFRSGIGHDYSDDFESCRSMKHYFMPKAQDWSKVKIFSPVEGTVVRIFSEWAGSQIHIQSKDYAAFTFRIFHVNLNSSITEGTVLAAGQQIGTHISNETMSDIAVAVHTSLDGPNDNTGREKGLRLISIFQLMTDSLLNTYGAASRSEFIIDAAERDSDAIQCNGEAFNTTGGIENWRPME